MVSTRRVALTPCWPADARWRLAGAAAGLFADRALGEPPERVHPVAMFGRAMASLEGAMWSDRRGRGAWFALLGSATGLGVGILALEVARSAAYGTWGASRGEDRASAAATLLATASATAIACAGRCLWQTALDVSRAARCGDLPGALLQLRALVGRDSTGFGTGDVARAVVESVAENTVDAIVAPALWAAGGGAAGALAYRAVNTLDSMVGHHSERYESFGWASARIDDVAGYVPARVTALLVACARPLRARAVLEAVRIDARRHPSPNSGVAEASFAAALGLSLGGSVRYGERTEQRPPLGNGRPADLGDIERAVQLSRQITSLLTASLLAASFVVPGGSASARARPRRPLRLYARCSGGGCARRPGGDPPGPA